MIDRTAFRLAKTRRSTGEERAEVWLHLMLALSVGTICEPAATPNLPLILVAPPISRNPPRLRALYREPPRRSWFGLWPKFPRHAPASRGHAPEASDSAFCAAPQWPHSGGILSQV